MSRSTRLSDDPVVVLGMHHSGTSILARVLSTCGVFMHADMPHHESSFFTREINDTMILGGGSHWADLPILPVAQVLERLPEVRRRIADQSASRYRAAGFAGGDWGFKDPRSCITLPLFLEIFPRARLVHILREAPAVARSLCCSSKKGVGVRADPVFWTRLRAQYVARAREFGSSHSQYHELRYERLCERPDREITALLDYLGIRPDRQAV
ncbi:MAG: sulfotransferase, partial [Gammaproteobacteria bacterium]|nr:sulfotransferase [Gammaproteobacteria bacterium]